LISSCPFSYAYIKACLKVKSFSGPTNASSLARFPSHQSLSSPPYTPHSPCVSPTFRVWLTLPKLRLLFQLGFEGSVKKRFCLFRIFVSPPRLLFSPPRLGMRHSPAKGLAVARSIGSVEIFSGVFSPHGLFSFVPSVAARTASLEFRPARFG